MDDEQLRAAAMEYHREPTPGKISIAPTKGLTNQHDLSLAYSPGVAFPCLAIRDNPLAAAELTSRANLVAVVTNGTAVLGLGNIGPLAGKPVMEGKACLFKKFAGIDVFDIEIDATEPDKIVEIVAALEPTFGGINLEDIKAPECFIVERKLRERMKIPVFHDDQHGTAIIVAAAVLNGLKLVGKDIREVRVAVSGAGAAALACLNLLLALGLKRESVFVCDIKGVVYQGRTEEMDPEKARFAQDTKARSLAEILPGADIFLGLSAGGVLKPEMLKGMAPDPLILALANPEPEIRPELAAQVRPDAILCTGRSDYPNQVNNVLCFPFIFRGALDVGATAINEEMKAAAVHAIAELARVEVSDVVASAYGGQQLAFGRDYIIPRPFDPRLIERVATAVARAAMETGVATRPVTDLDGYRERLSRFVYQSGTSMKPVFQAAKAAPRRVAYAEGEEQSVLRAVQVAVDERLAFPVLIGRPDAIRQRIESLGLRLRIETDCEIFDAASDPRTGELEAKYYDLMQRRGVTQAMAAVHMRSRSTLLAGMLLRNGHVDAMLCGTVGAYEEHLDYVRQVIGQRPGVLSLAAMNMLMLPGRQIFICDTYVNHNPDSTEIAAMTLLASEAVRRFGITPIVALLSHSSFGSSSSPAAQRMRDARAILLEFDPSLIVEGEMRGDAALAKSTLDGLFPGTRLPNEANLLVMPNIDAANISYNLLKVAAGNGITVGPILLGTAKPVHILEPGVSVRRIVNMTALAVVDASHSQQA